MTDLQIIWRNILFPVSIGLTPEFLPSAIKWLPTIVQVIPVESTNWVVFFATTARKEQILRGSLKQEQEHF